MSSSLTIATMKQVPIEPIRELLQKLQEFNDLDLKEVQLTENGVPIPVSDDWRFIGLSNAAFVELEYWKTAHGELL